MKNKKLKKTIYPVLIFILGVLATIYIERTNDWIFPKEIETVKLSKDTLIVIPISNKQNKTSNNEELENLRNESKYWRIIAKENYTDKDDLMKQINELNKNIVNNNNNSNTLIQKEIEDLKKKIEHSNDDTLFNYSEKNSVNINKNIKNNYNDIFLNVNNIFKNKKGYQPSNMTNYFKGNCPNFNVEEKYFDLEFSITNKNIFENASVVFISMTGINEKNQFYSIYDEYYIPKMGINTFRIKNVKSGKYQFSYGIIMKQDLDKEYPEVNGFICNFSK